MPPNPRVDRAFRAMKTLGIPGDKVKPVLKNLLRLYNKNWDLIEAENYRALADAIFESDEAKDSESTKPTENVEQEALVQDEPEPPLKRQRLKNQSSQPNESVESHLQNQSLGVFDSPQAIGNESLGRNKGKQPIFVQLISSHRKDFRHLSLLAWTRAFRFLGELDLLLVLPSQCHLLRMLLLITLLSNLRMSQSLMTCHILKFLLPSPAQVHRVKENLQLQVVRQKVDRMIITHRQL
ncbi:putative inactive histone-lysine N-methyltransferase SUVR2 isoform X1 [Capsicum chacoense]